MIVSGGHILAIDGINAGDSILGDGLRTPLEVNPEILEYYSAGPGIALHQGDEATEIENTDHIFYEVCSGAIDGTTMTVSAGHNRYCKLDIPSSITDLRIVVADTDDPTTVSKTMFEFTLHEDTKLSDVYVENTSGGECPLMGPMYWPGDVTYQGIVTNNIATIFGYSPKEELGPVISVDDGVPLDVGNDDHVVYNKSGIIGDGKRIYELDELDNLTIGTYVAVDEDDADSAQKFNIGKMQSDIYDTLQENEQAIVDLNDSLIDVSGELSDRIYSAIDAIESISNDLDTLGLEVDNLENTVSGHTTSISELQEDVEGIQSDISDLQDKDTQIEQDIGNLSDSIEDLDGRLTNDEDDIAAIAEVIPQDATSANKLVSETRLAQAIADFGGFEVVSLDPNTGEPDVQTPSEKIIYLTKDSQSTATDPYTEWIYRESEWQIIGETTVDLSNYYTKTETDDLLDEKVDKEFGKGLSTNDFTDAYKDKLDTITSGAEPNVQSDWEEVDSASDSYIKNKPDPLSIQAGDNISITESGSSLIISSQSAPQVNADWNSTSGVSEILNKPDLSVYAEIDDLASVAFTCDYEDLTNTPTEKTFSAGPNITIASADDTITIGATVPEQVQSDWEETDASALSYIKNKPAPLSLIPGNGISVSETSEGLEIAVSASYAETSAVNAALDNIEDEIDYVSGAVDKINTDLEDYVTETEMEEAIADFGGFKKVPVDQSGEPDVNDPSTKIIYLTHIDSATGPDLYREWLWDTAGPSWEMLGDTSISLQGYATEEYVQQETSGKVDAVEGYGLSKNDFTDELLAKLNNIAPSAEVNVQSDWSVTNSALDSYIANKPDIIIPQVGAGVSDMPKYIMVVTAMPPESQIDPNTIYLVQEI